MKALVVGGNGFIGSHLVDYLVSNAWEVVVLDAIERRFDAMPPQVHFVKGDLNQDFLVREALVGADIVFHLAWTMIHEVSNRDPVADIASNLIPSVHLIEACRLAGVRRIIFISSGGTIYGPAKTFPISESHPQNPITAYGVTKLAIEKYLYMFYSLSGLEYAILRPSVPYGPRQNPLGRQGAVAVFMRQVASELPVTIWGDGQISRDYFYVSDLVTALASAAQHKLSEQRVFNIGGSQEISLIHLLRMIENVIGKKAVVEYQPARNFDAPKIILDSSLAKHELDWSPTITLEAGLVNTWQWMRSILD